MPPPLTYLVLSGGEDTRASTQTQICGRDHRNADAVTVMRKVRVSYTTLNETAVLCCAVHNKDIITPRCDDGFVGHSGVSK